MGLNKKPELNFYPSYAPPDKWRNLGDKKKLNKAEWKKIRAEILIKDDYRCSYCEYRNEKQQFVHHIDGNPKNNSKKNLQTICRMCNLIKHAGMGCEISGVVDLYKKSNFSQIDIIRTTRKLRERGKNDKEIVKYLGLEHKMPFKMDKNYLKKLYGFVTSRRWKK